jgi:hypothetical protein
MKKRDKMCRCHKKQIGRGRFDSQILTGGMLSPAQMKKLMRPVRRFSTMPVRKPKQRGMGCGCQSLRTLQVLPQHGGDFLGIGSALSRTFSNPLRGLAAVGTMGLSETFLQPAEAVGKLVGVKPSRALKVASPFIGAVGSAIGNPELGMASKGSAEVLEMMGVGKKKRRKPKRRKPHRRRKK